MNNTNPNGAAPLSQLQPPDGWALVEQHIYRSNSLSAQQLPFLKHIGICTIVSLSRDAVRETLATALEVESIALHQPCAPTHKNEMEARVFISEEVVKETLQFALCPQNHPLLLTHANPGGLEVATLVGCLRRFQCWAISSILYEYRLFTHSPILYDANKQFIEHFDVSLVTLPSQIPEWLQYQDELLESECKAAGGDGGGPGTENDRLYFLGSNRCAPLASERVPIEERHATMVPDEED